MPTLQDVAEYAGVSTATVSKVLSNTPYVSDKTRAKVLSAVQALGYRPNLAARALSSGKTHIIAVVFPYIYDAIFKDPLVMHILEGVESIFTEQGYNILLSTPRLNDDDFDDHYMYLIQSGYADGIIAIDNVQHVSFAAEAERFNVPTVIMGYHTGDYVVHSDDHAGGALIMDHVLHAGHRQIGIITVPEATNVPIARRVQGMQSAYQTQGIATLPTADGDFSSQGGAQAVERLLDQHPDLSCVVSVNDRMAIGAINYLQSIGKRVPQDISVTGYDNISVASFSSPPLTTVDQTPVELGRQAAELILQRLNGKSPSTVVLPPRLIERGSVSQR